MKKQISSMLLMAMLALPMGATLSGCAMGNTAIANENEATLAQKLVPGKTRKTEVLNMFGEPSERAITGGRETWTYRMVDTKFRTYVPFAGIIAGNNGTMTTDLVITFDRAGVVARHDVVQFRG